jgi:hypothetical protein
LIKYYQGGLLVDILTKNNSSLQLYVNNGKGESVLYQNNSIDVNEGDLISIYAGETSEREVRKDFLKFPLHLFSSIARGLFAGQEKYIEERIEPFAFKCHYRISGKDIKNGIVIETFPSEYSDDSMTIKNAKAKINDKEVDVEQIPNPLHGKKILNSLLMDLSWSVMLIYVLSYFFIAFGINHIKTERGIGCLVLGVLLIIGISIMYIMRAIKEKRKINRMISLIKEKKDEKKR